MREIVIRLLKSAKYEGQRVFVCPNTLLELARVVEYPTRKRIVYPVPEPFRTRLRELGEVIIRCYTKEQTDSVEFKYAQERLNDILDYLRTSFSVEEVGE